MIKKWLIFLFFIILLSACANTTNTGTRNKDEVSLLQASTSYPQETSQQAKRLIADEHELNEVIAVNNDKLLVIGVEPKHHDRFRLEELRKSLKDTVKSSDIKHQIELSTDQKIILELRKLEEKLTERKLSKKQLTKELERIRKLSKEQT